MSLRNPQSAIRNPQSAIRNPQSAIRNPQSESVIHLCAARGAAALPGSYRADHAIFPESQLSAMAAQGYTQNSGSDWIGYVYPNTNGNVPAIQ